MKPFENAIIGFFIIAISMMGALTNYIGTSILVTFFATIVLMLSISFLTSRLINNYIAVLGSLLMVFVLVFNFTIGIVIIVMYFFIVIACLLYYILVPDEPEVKYESTG